MAEAFAIFGAIGTTFALLGLALKGYNNLVKTHAGFVKASQNVAEIEGRFERLDYFIQKWSEFWYLNLPMTDELLAAYWGQKATQLIASHLATVDRKCEDLAAILKPFIPDEEIPEAERQEILIRLQARGRRKERGKLQKIPKFQRAVWWTTKDSVSDLRAKGKEEGQILEEHIKGKTTIKKKAKFVLSSHETLRTLLDDIMRDYDELEKLSKVAWLDMHPKTHWETSDWKQKRIAGLAGLHTSVLQEAKRHREETKALHAFCSHDMKLDMNLLGDAAENACSKRFRLFIPPRELRVALQISAEPLQGDMPRNATCPTQFLEACEVAERAGRSFFKAPVQLNGDNLSVGDDMYFDLRKTSDNLQTRHYSISTLKTRLGTLSLAERIELAYRVTESGLLLFGTSWLSFLNSKTLHCLKISGQVPKYVLNIEQRTSIFQDQFRTEGWRLERHIFSIGIVLLEIALRVAVSNIEPSESGIKLTVVKEGTSHVWSPLNAFFEVKRVMKENYADAVKFCLQDPGTASNREWVYGIFYDDHFTDEQKSLELLDLYFNKVFVK